MEHMTDEIASAMAHKRWDKIPKKKRAAMVPRNGGRPRIYPKCPRYKAHRFSNDRCPCGYSRASR